MIRDLFSTDPDWSLTIIRIILGVVFFAHGAQKFFGWSTEFLGGVGLIVGLLSRVAAVGIGVTMMSAIVMVHGRNGLFMDWLGARKNHGYEFHLLAIALAVVLVAKGSGALSLDRFLFNSLGV